MSLTGSPRSQHHVDVSETVLAETEMVAHRIRAGAVQQAGLYDKALRVAAGTPRLGRAVSQLELKLELAVRVLELDRMPGLQPVGVGAAPLCETHKFSTLHSQRGLQLI